MKNVIILDLRATPIKATQIEHLFYLYPRLQALEIAAAGCQWEMGGVKCADGFLLDT